MFLGVIALTLDLGDLPDSEKERVIRSLKDKMKSTFGSRVQIRSDSEYTLYLCALHEQFEKLSLLLSQVSDKADSAGDARIEHASIQILQWFEGAFRNTAAEELSAENLFTGKTIIYEHDDDMLEGAFNRRSVRLPVRK